MTFEKLPPVPGSKILDMDAPIWVGFGCAGYSKDGNFLWQQSEDDEYEDCPTVDDVERIVKSTETEHDWRIFFYAPHSEADFQRQGDGLWVRVKIG